MYLTLIDLGRTEEELFMMLFSSLALDCSAQDFDLKIFKGERGLFRRISLYRVRFPDLADLDLDFRETAGDRFLDLDLESRVYTERVLKYLVRL